MSIALYRQYRPKTFAEVTSQNHIKITLQNELETNKLAHAYLFCGPRGTGKTTTARLLSKAANCLNRQKDGEPCNQCDSCLEIMANKSLDIIEIDAASHTGVDNVRENIINNARFTPAKAKYKIFIIDEVHMLSISAFNALLKILEEPPKHVIFILATTEVHKVPVTIISRCQRFDFKKIVFSSLVDRLRWIVNQENIEVEEKILEVIAKNSGGCVRDAESLLEQVLSLDDKKITFDQAELILPRSDFDNLSSLLEYLIKKNSRSAIELVNNLVEEGVDIVQYTNNLVEFLRKVLFYKLQQNIAVLVNEFDETLTKKIMVIVENVKVKDLADMISIILEKKEQFRQSYILQLPLEIAILEIIENNCRPAVPENFQKKSFVEKKTEIQAPVFQERIEKTEVVGRDEHVEKEKKIKLEIKKEKPKDIKQSAEENKENITVTFNQILARWPLILQQVQNKNYSLGMSLRVAKPVELEGDKLVLGFLFDLQRDRVDNPVNLELIEKVILSEFGNRINICATVDSSLKLKDITNNETAADSEIKVEQQETKDPLGTVLDAFGGSVVDKI